MSINRKTTAATIALILLAGTSSAVQAADQFSFPSANGAAVASSTSQFAPVAPSDGPGALPAVGSAVIGAGATKGGDVAPLPVGSADYKARFGMRPYGGDPYAYRFFTHALASQSFANYAADYYRLFTPGYAVQAWTDRVAGFVETGYGGAVDSWTGGAYYLARLRGPSRGRNSPPDLSTMPTFRAHPELETHPTFDKSN